MVRNKIIISSQEISDRMSPQPDQKSSVETHLEEALGLAECSETRYHIREALQLIELEP